MIAVRAAKIVLVGDRRLYHLLKAYDPERPGCLLLDLRMPGMGGLVFAETVRKSGRWTGLPLIALSSHTEAEDLERGRAAGFTDYVSKSDRDTLISVLAESFANSVPAIAA